MGELTAPVRIPEFSNCKTWYEIERVCGMTQCHKRARLRTRFLRFEKSEILTWAVSSPMKWPARGAGTEMYKIASGADLPPAGEWPSTAPPASAPPASAQERLKQCLADRAACGPSSRVLVSAAPALNAIGSYLVPLLRR